jgi:hypothetical protein
LGKSPSELTWRKFCKKCVSRIWCYHHFSWKSRLQAPWHKVIVNDEHSLFYWRECHFLLEETSITCAGISLVCPSFLLSIGYEL